MYFVVIKRSGPPRRFDEWVALHPDNWDDYGFKTTFDLTLHRPGEVDLFLGSVKFARRGQESLQRSSDIIPSEFGSLSDDWISLGQDPSYYEVLDQLPKKTAMAILRRLHDASLVRDLRVWEAEETWRTSLTRFGAAEEALVVAKSTFGNVRDAPSRSHSLNFSHTTREGRARINFEFSSPFHYVSRVNVLVGYNGSGKTTILSDLARLAHSDRRERGSDAVARRHGTLDVSAPRFSAVIMISYSAFDTFELPQKRFQSDESRDEIASMSEEAFGYAYCGLRTFDGADIRSQAALRDEFSDTLERVHLTGRTDALAAAFEELEREPSFGRSLNLRALLLGRDSDPREVYEGLSTGHKIALSIIAHLTLRIQRRSLVLIDEPESHLHPSLLSALLRIVSNMLAEADAVAIVATHSPVVLQEVPARSVHVVKRYGDITEVENPRIETLGENLSLIMAHAFDVDSDRSDFHETLRELAGGSSLRDVLSRFPQGLGLEATSYLISLGLQP